MLGDIELVSWPLPSVGPDLHVIDGLARLQLVARRMGYSIRVRDASGELMGLLELVGLGDVVPGGVRGEVRGEAEHREQGGVDEVVVPDDPVA